MKLRVELKPEGGVGVVVFPQSGLKVYCFPSKTQLLAYPRSFMCLGGGVGLDIEGELGKTMIVSRL